MANKEAGDRIRFKLSLADEVGAAFHQNSIPVLNELIVENRLGRDLRDLKLEIRSEPPFTVPANWRIDELADGKSIPVVNPDIQLDAGYLNKLTEAVRGSLQLALREGKGVSQKFLTEPEYSAQTANRTPNARPPNGGSYPSHSRFRSPEAR